MKKVILYIDDDEDDREMLVEAIYSVDPKVDVVLADDGLQALDYLDQSKKKGDPAPCLIVLDLNMPFLNGKDTFDRIREDQAFSQIPIIIYSSSGKPADKKMFNLQGIEFFTKPANIGYIRTLASHMVEVCGKRF